jgi:DNA polymerase III subunit gamma/tau
MSYQVLARKYRPQKFSEVIGQEHVTQTLKNAIEQGRTAHGYIFSGHRGIGKTTVARILAMALNCRSTDHPVPEPCGTCESCTEIRAGNSVDVLEIDAATNRGIDEIRELREAARYRPARDRYKIYILDEAHQITDAAFNALLKTLEEPPSHVVFMLATTQPEDIPQTIRSRCQHFSFRAVRFEQILQQLKDLASKEDVAADDDALALLAEAGDGSMRDALSIMDQAIASSDRHLTADSVRQLVGAVTSSVLEDVMKAISNGSSNDVLRLLDNLISEGHSPTHFARQMVRFLRNTVVARVAGPDSSLLQISGDERARVARVAELFSEEDLARHLQIMLRTHSELGYKHEQRFHLELGLLKMAHAQRLLPLEQLLSDAAGQSTEAQQSRSLASVPSATDNRRSTAGTAASARSTYVSPFAADSARKGTPKAETGGELTHATGPRLVSSVPASAAVVVGATAPAPAAVAEPDVLPEPARQDLAAEPETRGAAFSPEPTAFREAVVNAITNTGQRMLASMLDSGEWNLEGNELVIKVAASPTVLDMSFSTEAKRLIIAAASGVLGKPARLKVLPGSTVQPTRSTMGSNGSSRGRAEQEPVVRRMQEKFGAQIRTVIDYRDKR